MRRWIAAVTTTAAAAVLASALPVPAHAAAPKSQVSALKRQFTAGHGVRVKETTTVRWTSPQAGSDTMRFHTRGAYQFGASGVVASDLTHRSDFGGAPAEVEEPTRTITLRNASYVAENSSYDLPEGKTWLRFPETGGPAVTQMINVLEPATLRGLLRTTETTRRGVKLDGISTTVRKGTVTVARLYALSPSFRTMYGDRPRGASAKLTIDWKLWQDAEKRTRKLVSSYTETDTGLHVSARTTVTSRVVFSGWGARTAITAPPAASVLDVDAWNPVEDEEPPALSGLSVPLPGREQ
ncbi:hypothetical protein GCM10010466_01290 [Planomonospora alba]|uniref:Uncharacterized protein n=1 Tax=Planomonospora alba TaxID=161354 RepID=A0ABP6MJN2_9ACTN